MEHKTKLIVRGGGDLASGVIHRLYRCGYRVLVLECRRPSAIRRKVSFGEAVYDGLDVALDFRVFHKRHAGADEHVELASELLFVLDAETAEKRGLRRDRALKKQGE